MSCGALVVWSDEAGHRTPFWSAGYVVWLAFRRIGGVGFRNEKAIFKSMKVGYYIFNALIASNFDFRPQRINDTTEVWRWQIWAREEAREASLLRRHSRRYRTECSRCPCEFVRSRWRHLRGISKGICCPRGKRTIQSLWGHYRGYKKLRVTSCVWTQKTIHSLKETKTFA